MAGKLETPGFRLLAWVQEVTNLGLRRNSGGSCFQGEQASSPFSAGTQGGPQTGRLGSLATRDCSEAAAWGMGS